MTEVVVWTLIFMGGDLAVIVGLMWLAIAHDRKQAQESPDA